MTVNEESSSEKMQTITYGDAVSLNCSHEDGETVKWFINGDEQEVGDAIFTIHEFSLPGFYQCQVAETQIRTVTLCGIGKQ